MKMPHQIYTCILAVLLQIYFIQCIQYKDLAPYLTLNISQHWLRDQSNKWLSNNPYCLICCMNINDNIFGKICGKHTMCRYNEMPGPTCKGFISIGFTKDEITAIVDIHNTLRNSVAMGWETRGNPGPQPNASNMRVVEWDAELALVANRWAAQCVFAHDLCRDLAKYPVGQNIAKGNYALNNDLSFIVQWYNTVELFDGSEIAGYRLQNKRSYPTPSQYTQLIWAETSKIGCARVAFHRSSGFNLSYREHFICNYGPSGNIPGQPVYKIGDPCSECPDGTGCGIEYPGLCTSEDISDIKYTLRPKSKSKESITSKSHLESSGEATCHRFSLKILLNRFIYVYVYLYFLVLY